MKIGELCYHTIETDDGAGVKMVDLLLARAIGRDNYRIFRSKSNPNLWRARFWGTEGEFQEITEALSRCNGEWIDEEYEKLLSEQ